LEAKRRRKRYSREFKLEVIRQFNESGKSASQIARELNMPSHNVYKWCDEAKRLKEGVWPGSGKIASNYKDSELRRLRVENDKLRQERDILKKTIIFFAKDQESGLSLSKSIKIRGR